MAKKAKQENAKLRQWQERYRRSEQAYSAELARMDEREDYYFGRAEVKTLEGRRKKTVHCRNVVAENIEAQVSTSIPQPKVTALRQEDEWRAELIERLLRAELDRLPMERLNDLDERTTPIQGGDGFHVEWENHQRSHLTTGEVVVQLRHPKQMIPQEGVTEIEEMDYFFLRVPQTRRFIERKYGVVLESQGEELPEIRGSGGETEAEEMVTQLVAYERGEGGGINRYSWVDDTELEDLQDYQARRLKRCGQCGRLEPIDGERIVLYGEETDRQAAQAAMEAALAEAAMSGTGAAEAGAPIGAETPERQRDRVWHSGDPCPYCGADKWTEGPEEWEEIYVPMETARGTVIPGATQQLDGQGRYYQEPTKLPMYKPDVYPVVLRKNVSAFGRFLGESDVDKIRDQQNTISIMEDKILRRFCKAGTRISLPNDPGVRMDENDQEVIYVPDAAKLNMIKTFDFTGDLSQELVYLAQVYEESRQAIGITDSFQGRADSTATSGKAKQFSAAQAAGRLESKRAMKEAVYAEIFERIFKLHLAYDDEPRQIPYTDKEGRRQYQEFNRYDFLEKDAAGNYWWNDRFLFSCDTSAPLANNREKLWEETVQFFSAGAFGDPGSVETRILLWTKLELLHYPGAGETRAWLEEQLQRQQEAQLQQMQMQQAAMRQQTMQQAAQSADGQQIVEQARQDALADALGAVEKG